MSARDMLKYHLLVPVGIFVVLVVVGVPLGTAFFIGMMSGCMSMMVMMMGSRGHDSHADDDDVEDRSGRR